MAMNIRGTAWDSSKKKHVYKTVSVSKHGKDGAKKILDDWRLMLKTKRPDMSNVEMTEDIEDSTFMLPVTKFKIELSTDTGSTIAEVGASKSGKTTLMKYIYKHFVDPKKWVTVLFALNAHAQIYKDFGKDIVVSKRFYPEVIRAAYTIQNGCDNKYSFLFMFDDIIGDDTKNSSVIKELISVYRNSNMSTIISLQGVQLLSKLNRSNINYITFHHMNNDEAIEDNIKKFLSSYLGGKMNTLADKISLYKEMTKDHHFLLLDNLNEKISRHKV